MDKDALQAVARSMGVPPRGSPDAIRRRIREARARATSAAVSESQAVQPAADPMQARVAEAWEAASREINPGTATNPASVSTVAGKIVAAIRSGTYEDVLHPNNKVSRRVFERLTGVKLPPSVSKTRALFTGKPFEVRGDDAVPDDGQKAVETRAQEPATQGDEGPVSSTSSEVIEFSDGTSMTRHSLSNGMFVDVNNGVASLWRRIGPAKNELGVFPSLQAAIDSCSVQNPRNCRG
jgi:hypothetical protein